METRLSNIFKTTQISKLTNVFQNAPIVITPNTKYNNPLKMKNLCYLYFFIIYFQDTNAALGNGRSSPPKVFLKKGVPEICSKFTWEHPCWSAISRKFQSNLIEITLRHGCSPVNLMHIYGTRRASSEMTQSALPCSNFIRMQKNQLQRKIIWYFGDRFIKSVWQSRLSNIFKTTKVTKLTNVFLENSYIALQVTLNGKY